MLPNEGTVLRFVSWNIKGINGPVKRGKVFSHLKQLKTDIAFLQETRLLIKDHHRLKAQWVGQAFHSNFDNKSRGTAILIHKRIKFIPQKIITDTQGRFIILSGLFNDVKTVLVNLYAPNWDDEAFFQKIISLLPDLNTHRLILGGDLNCTMNPSLDKSSFKYNPPNKMAKSITSFMNQIGGTDPWRFHHPNEKQFSFYSPVHKTFTRIDYFFIDNALLPGVKSTQYSHL